MQRRQLGRTGLSVSALGFGCGSVGGLMVRGSAGEQERAVARAIELGVNYFDTAQQYGNGKSEESLGRALKALRRDVVVATKVKVPDVAPGEIAGAIATSLEASLGRLGRDHVDLFQLHNTITSQPARGALTPEAAIEAALPALERLQAAGKVRFFGMTALGETAAIQRVVETGRLFTAQVAFNLLNPSPGEAMPSGYPAQDYDRLLDRLAAVSMGAVVIRVVAGGALGGEGPRHPLARSDVDPMGTGSSLASDLARARRLEALVAEGHASSLFEASVRYVLAHPAVSTVLVGFSGLEQVEEAARAVAKGALGRPALDRVRALQAGFAGERR